MSSDAATADLGLLILVVLAISPAVLLGEVMVFRRACLPPGEGPLWLGAVAFAAGVASGPVLFWALQRVPSVGPPLNELLFGPLREELLKAAVLALFLYRRRDLRYGMWLGAAVGMGFAAFENHFAAMAAGSVSDFLRVAFFRTLLCPLHGLTSAIAGVAISTRQWWLFAPALLLHAAWNAVADVPDMMIRPLIKLLHLRGAEVQDAWTLLLALLLFAALAVLVHFARARRGLSASAVK